MEAHDRLVRDHAPREALRARARRGGRPPRVESRQGAAARAWREAARVRARGRSRARGAVGRGHLAVDRARRLRDGRGEPRCGEAPLCRHGKTTLGRTRPRAHEEGLAPLPGQGEAEQGGARGGGAARGTARARPHPRGREGAGRGGAAPRVDRAHAPLAARGADARAVPRAAPPPRAPPCSASPCPGRGASPSSCARGRVRPRVVFP